MKVVQDVLLVEANGGLGSGSQGVNEAVMLTGWNPT